MTQDVVGCRGAESPVLEVGAGDHEHELTGLFGHDPVEGGSGRSASVAERRENPSTTFEFPESSSSLDLDQIPNVSRSPLAGGSERRRLHGLRRAIQGTHDHSLRRNVSTADGKPRGRRLQAVMKSRDYLAGTQEALVHLSDGFCYYPGCDRAVIEFVDGHPMMAVEISHIHAASPGGPYYDTSMSDEDRRHFDNLILLCKPHHTLVDK